MVGHGDQVVLGRRGDVLVDQVVGHVQVTQREIDQRIDLVTVVATVREAFQVNHEDLGQIPQIEFLGRLFVGFAFGTVPVVLLAQLLNFGVEVETLGQADDVLLFD